MAKALGAVVAVLGAVVMILDPRPPRPEALTWHEAVWSATGQKSAAITWCGTITGMNSERSI